MNNFDKMRSEVKLIVSEVDGIITEGLSPIDNGNFVMYKLFYMRDFEAINLLKKRYNFVFLSSDNNVTFNIMRTRNIPFYWASKDKTSKLREIMTRYEVKHDQVMYIGCNHSDIPCVNMIPLSMCPNDAAAPIKRILNRRKEQYNGMLSTFGGGGIISEVYDILCN